MQKLRKLYFDPEFHKYTDEYKNEYTSMTTIIGKYVKKFDIENVAKACERIGKNPTHPKYEKYKGKTAKQLIKEWLQKSEDACTKGNDRHNYLEDIINVANGFITSDKKYTGNRIYTIEDIMQDHEFGRINMDYFTKSGLKERYPDIFNIIVALHEKGYYFYAELGVFDPNRLVSGLVDLPAFHHDKKVFIVVDWKTNANDIIDRAGYWDKDREGNTTGKFIDTAEYFAPPIDNIPASMLHKYSMQLSGYSVLIELHGYTNKGNIICHIQDKNGKEVVTPIRALDLRNSANIMFDDFYKNLSLNTQKKIFI